MAARKPRLTLAKIAAYCDTKSGAVRTTPFGPEPLVFKVAGRMFALLGHLDGNEVVSLKCDPERSAVLRASYDAIVPGYHLNKEHWNTLILDGSLPPPLVTELIDHSYELTNKKKPSKPRSSRRRASQ
jgi:predicted DNA-binding protein (MmcQ/YjbR family)